MIKTLKRVMSAIAVIFLSALLLLCGGGAFAASADTAGGVRAAYEQSNVWDNLQGATIGGNAFNADDYPASANGKPQLISLVEFCYSIFPEKQGDFGLYIYVYNPQETELDTRARRGSIKFSFGDSSYDSYDLDFLNYSTAEGYGHRFYKFRVVLSSSQRQRILSQSSDTRVYNVSVFTLATASNNLSLATGYKCAQTYTYTGFAPGYGSDQAGGDTLSCIVNGFDKYAELDVKHTVYRPKGDYFEGKQSQLNSCYFRVPEKYFTDYGELSQIVCEWYEYITQPMLVTESDYLYKQFYSLHGADVINFNPDMYFLLFMLGNKDTAWLGPDVTGYKGYFSNYPVFDDFYKVSFPYIEVRDMEKDEVRYDNFAATFYTGKDKSYKERSVSSEELTQQLQANTKVLGGPLINGRYSEALFTGYVNPHHTRGYNKKTIKKDDLLDIFWNVTTKNFWQSAFGGYDVETIYDAVKAIVTLSDDDLAGSDDEIAMRLYVSAGDVADIKSEYAKAKENGERLVLFRFGESDYYSIRTVDSYCSTDTNNADFVLVKDCAEKNRDGKYTGYAAQETVYLDFDIISLWFTADNVETEIPAVASPTDAIGGLTPPLEENYHNEGSKAGIIIAVVVVVVIALVLLISWIVRKNREERPAKPPKERKPRNERPKKERRRDKPDKTQKEKK